MILKVIIGRANVRTNEGAGDIGDEFFQRTARIAQAGLPDGAVRVGLISDGARLLRGHTPVAFASAASEGFAKIVRLADDSM
jgi:hypothetical protein